MNRDIKLDILKVIGLLCIILAHVNPPQILFQVRNFDVILMLLISSCLFFKSKKNISSVKEYFKYVKKRVVRLLFPTWIFLIIYFLLNIFLKFANYDFKTIIKSFALFKSGTIGYVWIIRIYILAAIILPIYKFFYDKNSMKTTITVYIVYIIYEILAITGIFNITILEYLFAYIAPIILIVHLSKELVKCEKRKVLNLASVNFIIFIFVGLLLYIKNGSIQPTQIMKYPFRVYYISYSLFISFILFFTINNIKIKSKICERLINFISTNSLWIYLIHIIFVQIIDYKLWYINFIIVVLLTLLAVKIKNYILSMKCFKRINIIKMLNG